MRAIVYSETGDTSVLRLVERETPEPGPGEVRVRVVVSGVNPTDWKSRRGRGSVILGDETVPNQDGAGIVDAVGTGVTSVTAGDRVWLALSGWQRPSGGTAQEFTVLPAERVFALPDSASFDVGASLGVPALTAHRALTVAEGGPTRLSPGALAGRMVLVAGGAGAVGHAAVQLARWAGATVIATVSTDEKEALATAAGAHHVVRYREPDAADRIRSIAPDGVDLIVEPAVAANDALDRAVAHSGTTIAVYANDGSDAFPFDVLGAMRLNLRYQFVLLYTVDRDALAAGAADVIAAVRDGALPVGADAGLPLHRFALDATAEAHRAVEGNTVGKVLIDVS